jgi:hypothetical protein
MAISIICYNCNATYNVPPHLAGKTVTCKRCNAILDVPDERGYHAPVAAGPSTYNRIVGKPNPIGLEIVGITTKLDGEFGTREIFQLLWGLRHIALLIALLILWSQFASTPESAQLAAPFFFFAAIASIIAGWVQLMTIARNLAGTSGSAAPLISHVLSSFVLISSDFRAALPAIRTLFLGIVTFFVSLAIASQAGGISYVLPLHFLPGFHKQQTAPREYTPLPTEQPDLFPKAAPKATKPPPPPPPPPEDEKPLPPPEDVLPPPT